MTERINNRSGVSRSKEDVLSTENTMPIKRGSLDLCANRGVKKSKLIKIKLANITQGVFNPNSDEGDTFR